MSSSDVGIEPSSRSAIDVWRFFDDITDVSNLNPAEEQQEAWEALLDGECVGMAVVDTIPSEAFVSRVAVKPAYRDRGVGTALLETIHDEHGALACRVREDNDAGQALVESLGFIQVESRRHDLRRYELSAPLK